MKKIRIQLQGGLGNQLFIWAIAHDLAINTGRKIQLEYIRDRKQRLDRPIEIKMLLEHCDHSISIHESSVLGVAFRVFDKINRYSELFATKGKKLVGIYDCTYPFETPEFKEKLPRIIRGFFQSYEMVERNAVPLEMELRSMLSSVKSYSYGQNSLVMHVRRGDTREIAKSWGVLSVQYYKRHHNDGEPVIICTDDESEVDTLLRTFPTATFLTPSTTSTWETLNVLTRAKKLVIANSTLSWWAAWLNSKISPDLVYFPDPWRPGERVTSEKLRINSVQITNAEFEE